MSYSMIAQESNNQQEIGLVFSNLDNFGLTYKVGSSRSLWRFNTMILLGDHYEETSVASNAEKRSLKFDIKTGNEFHKVISDNFEFRFGADISFRYSKVITNNNNLVSIPEEYSRLYELKMYEPGINLVIGLNYLFGKNLLIGAELLPGVSYRFGESFKKIDDGINIEEEMSDISGITYGISNSSILMTLGYRF